MQNESRLETEYAYMLLNQNSLRDMSLGGLARYLKFTRLGRQTLSLIKSKIWMKNLYLEVFTFKSYRKPNSKLYDG